MSNKNFFESGNTVVMMTAADLREYSLALLQEFKQTHEEHQPEKWYTPTEFAKAVGVDVSTLWRWSKRGQITSHVIAGRKMFRMSDYRDNEK